MSWKKTIGNGLEDQWEGERGDLFNERGDSTRVKRRECDQEWSGQEWT